MGVETLSRIGLNLPKKKISISNISTVGEFSGLIHNRTGIYPDYTPQSSPHFLIIPYSYARNFNK